MDCPSCGVYNPEGRTVCWRCDQELPRPQVKKKQNPAAARRRTWILLGIALLIWVLLTFLLPFLLGGLRPAP